MIKKPKEIPIMNPTNTTSIFSLTHTAPFYLVNNFEISSVVNYGHILLPEPLEEHRWTRCENSAAGRKETQLKSWVPLFTIIRVTEALEAAYSRDAVTEKKYSEECLKLIAQFKSTESALIERKTIKNATEFMERYQISYPRATERLIKYGVPSTVIHSTHDDQGTAYLSAQATQAFITLMDAIRLDKEL